jgi:two-component sensor histidine kinase
MDLMMGESDHRIRNNLQMILSVVRTAQRAAESNDVHAAFEDIVHKMQAVLQAQLTLERVRVADSFSADEFLRELCANLRAASPAEFAMHVNCEPIYLPRKLAMPLALIANELVTNAIKYGLRGEQRNVRVSLVSCCNDLELKVQDDGPGIDNACLQNSQSGLRTVRYLASQMRGEVLAGPGPGAHIIVRFEHSAA